MRSFLKYLETLKDLKSKKNSTSNITQWRILCTKITVLCSKNRWSVNATLAKMTKAKSCQSSVHLSCCYFFYLLCKVAYCNISKVCTKLSNIKSLSCMSISTFSRRHCMISVPTYIQCFSTRYWFEVCPSSRLAHWSQSSLETESAGVGLPKPQVGLLVGVFACFSKFVIVAL